MLTAGQTTTIADNPNDNIRVGGALTFGGAGNVTINDVIQDNTTAGSIIKTGGGTLTFSGANTYTGATTVNNGTLLVSGTMRGTSGMTVNSGAILELGAVNMFTTGHGTAMDNAKALTANGGTLLMNGAHDASNAIATCVATRSMSPGRALAMAAIMNFAGVFLMTYISSAVAQTIFKMVNFSGDNHAALLALAAAMVAIVVGTMRRARTMPVGMTRISSTVIAVGIAIPGVAIPARPKAVTIAPRRT